MVWTVLRIELRIGHLFSYLYSSCSMPYVHAATAGAWLMGFLTLLYTCRTAGAAIIGDKILFCEFHNIVVTQRKYIKNQSGSPKGTECV